VDLLQTTRTINYGISTKGKKRCRIVYNQRR